MRNKLKNHLAYLCGPMDDAEDFGIGWRLNMQRFLWDLGIGVLNPTDKPTELAKEDVNTSKNILKLKSEKKYNEVATIMKGIVNIDLGLVDLSNFLIIYIDRNKHMCGSYGEQTHACLQRKPIIVCCKQGKDNVPNWLYGIADHELFFNDWEQVKSYINKVDEGKVNNVERGKNKWQFFDFDKIFNR